ncbi:MAG: hypothetical protein ACHQ50_14240, partial [Fimbriimonadales bacterium]
YNVVVAKMDDKDKKTITFYLDPADKLAKVGEYVLKDAGATETVIVRTKDYLVDGAPKADTFAFVAPEDSKEISLVEMNSGKWYENFAEAQAMSKKTGKPMLVDYYADW